MKSFLVRLCGMALLGGSMMVGQGKAPEERAAPKFDIANIDRSLDPCVDFYQYACSNWIKNNPIPSDYSEWISFAEVEEHNNAVLRSVPEIREVIDVSKVVENRIQQAFTRKALQPMAERIIHGLSIHRLTTDDIRAKIGPTAEELQNGLCLFAAIPERTSDFLRTTVEACLKEVMKTMSGQFITHNTDFGDAFEREGDMREYFLAFAGKGYAVGVNVILYALTH